MATELLSLSNIKTYWASIQRATDVLAAGGLVAFPTETVYGIGANAADPTAIGRLREIKRRAADKPFTVHVGRRSDLDRFVTDASPVGRRLVAKAWPGPLTLIFPVPDCRATAIARDLDPGQLAALYHNGTVGLRCPDSPAAHDLLTGVTAPVVAASANRADGEPALSAADVLAAFDDDVDVVLDGPTPRYAKPSTIVTLNGDGFMIQREGVYDARTIRRLATINVLLVCTGNTCRSPMAAAVCRKLLADRLGCAEDRLDNQGYTVASAGAFAMSGAPASSGAYAAMAARGLDMRDHRSQPITVELVHQADHIFVMGQTHREAVLMLVPSAAERTRLLDDPGEIDDPIGGGDRTYEACAETIERSLERRLPEILA